MGTSALPLSKVSQRRMTELLGELVTIRVAMENLYDDDEFADNMYGAINNCAEMLAIAKGGPSRWKKEGWHFSDKEASDWLNEV